jgi:excisionase family DNA binding protein
MDIDTLPEMLRVDEAAKLLRISRSRAYDEVAAFQRSGGAEGIPSIRIGRSLRVPKRKLLAWIEAKLSGPDAA